MSSPLTNLSNLLRIGDFSQLAQVSVPTLRHYDEVGLIKPTHVDQFTDYRYYALDQLPRLNRILALKDLGLSLDQIKQLLGSQLPAAHLRDLLTTKRGEIAQQLEREQQRLARVEARLRQIEAEDAPPKYEVVLKKVEAQFVVGARQTVPHVSQMGDFRGAALERVYGWLHEQGVDDVNDIQGELMLYHNTEYSDEHIEMEAAVAISSSAAKALAKTNPTDNTITLYELPALTKVASTIHHGPMFDIPQAIIAVFAWIASNGYRSAGTIRELHLFGREVDLQTEEAYQQPIVLEMQIPVERE